MYFSFCSVPIAYVCVRPSVRSFVRPSVRHIFSQVRQRHRLMEERAQEEKQKATAAEAKVVKLQAKVKNLNEENTQLRQILQQIQVRDRSLR